MQNEEIVAEKEKADALAKKYAALYDYAPSGYFTLNRNGHILEMNITGASMLRKNPDELLGCNFTNFFNQNSLTTFKKFIEKVYTSCNKQQCELAMNFKDNEEVYLYLEGIVWDNDNCFLTLIDISESHKAEKALHKSETQLQELNVTKDKFFTIIAHDLRGPFTSIMGLTDLLSIHVKNKNFENIERISDIIHYASLKAMDLLSNLMEWTRLQTGKIKYNPQQVKISTIFDNVLGVLDSSIKQKSITLSKEVNDDIIVWADRDMLSNVIRNLLSNAIKFTPQNKSIDIQVAEQEETYLFTITDTGVGIEPEDQKKLFRIDIGYSTKGTMNEEGTGLGLILCADFIAKHGGKIWVESEPGKGSKFSFTIPRIQKKGR